MGHPVTFREGQMFRTSLVVTGESCMDGYVSGSAVVKAVVKSVVIANMESD